MRRPRLLAATHVVALTIGASAGAGATALAASHTTHTGAAFPCPTRSLAARVSCLEGTLTAPGPGGSGSVLAARETVRNWCVFLEHQTGIDTGSDAVSVLMRNWKLSCSAFRR